MPKKANEDGGNTAKEAAEQVSELLPLLTAGDRAWLTEWLHDTQTLRPNPTDTPHTVAILGKGADHDKVTFGLEGWEYWGLNEWSYNDGPLVQYTRWFQLHPPHYLRVHYPRGIEDLARHWTYDRGVRLYMDRYYKQYPDSEAYPKADVEALTDTGWYHASSFDWMLALAILEGFPHIKLYGCGQVTFPGLSTEPISARACLEYWIGVAEGRGIDVSVIDPGDVLKIVHLAKMVSQKQYGFDNEPALDLGKQGAGWVDVR